MRNIRAGNIKRQAGALSIFAALAMMVLLGSVGLAVDAARVYAVHDELQNAVDACALSAALELNGGSDATARAALAGRFVAARNKTGLQSSPVLIPPEGITFSSTVNGNFVTAANISSASARFVRCTAKLSGFSVLLMSVLGVEAINLSAQTTAAVVPSQSTCSLPMALCAGSSTSAGNIFGYAPGSKAVLGSSSTSGFFSWADVSGAGGGSGIETYYNAFVASGTCGAQTAAGRCVAIKAGVVSSLDDGWNSRFGVYKSGGSALSPQTAIPDLSGYGYRGGTSPAGGWVRNYLDTQVPNRSPNQLTIPGYNTAADVNRKFGSPYRRLTVMPIVQCNSSVCGSSSKPVVGWACVLLLAAKGSSENAEVEFLARADDPNSPCRVAGVPGGSLAIGPLVPVIVK